MIPYEYICLAPGVWGLSLGAIAFTLLICVDQARRAIRRGRHS